MKRVCIPKEYVNQFKEALNSGDTLSRQKKFEEILGNKSLANDINLQYEKSLLLKNQDLAFERFLNKYTDDGSIDFKRARERYQAEKTRKQDLLDNEELDAIIGETLERKFDIDIPEEDLNRIATIQREKSKLEKAMEGTEEGSKERMEYGRKAKILKNEIENMVNPKNTKSLVDSIKAGAKTTKDRFNESQGFIAKTKESGRILKEILQTDASKAFQAAWDNSGFGRQGLRYLSDTLNPWSPTKFSDFRKSVSTAFKSTKNFTNKEKLEFIKSEFDAFIISQSNFNEKIKAGLKLDTVEQFFPVPAGEKLPGFIGGGFKASDDTYSMFIQKNRNDMYDRNVSAFETIYGRKLTDEERKAVASAANSISGAGTTGNKNLDSFLNKLFFSGQWIKSSIDFFTKPFTAKTAIERTMYRRASAAQFTVITTILGGASVMGLEVGWDPRDSKFGKVKMPGSEVWTDVTAGLGSYVTTLYKLSSRWLFDAKKTPYNEPVSVLASFAANKTSPVVNALIQLARQEDYSGEKPEVSSLMLGLYTPISVQNFVEAIEEADGTEETFNRVIIPAILDFVGFSNRDYEK